MGKHDNLRREYVLDQEKEPKMKTAIKAFINIVKVFQPSSSKDDPVKHCEVYKDKGCGFVDGYLCNMKTCPIREGYIEGKKINENIFR